MSSKFRKDSHKRKYTVRTFLRRCLGFGLICLLLVFMLSSLLAFYLFIHYEVRQAVEISYMKNLQIRSSNIKTIKMNELEAVGTGLSIYAEILSDLTTHPERFAEQEYLDAYASFLQEGTELGQCNTKNCEND